MKTVPKMTVFKHRVTQLHCGIATVCLTVTMNHDVSSVTSINCVHTLKNRIALETAYSNTTSTKAALCGDRIHYYESGFRKHFSSQAEGHRLPREYNLNLCGCY